MAALAPVEPYLRGAPPGLPFRLDAETLTPRLNFTLQAASGDLDLLGEVTGGGRYGICCRSRTHPAVRLDMPLRHNSTS